MKPRKSNARLGVYHTRDNPRPYVVTAVGPNLVYRRKYAKTATVVPIVDVIDRIRGHEFSVNNQQYIAVPGPDGVRFQSYTMNRVISWSDLLAMVNGQRMLL